MEVTENPEGGELQEINEKINIIQKIINNCNTEHYHKSSAFKNLLTYFTGANKQVIDQVLNEFQRRMTFKDWLESEQENKVAPIVSYEHLRNTIIDQYVNKLHMSLRSTIFTDITALGYFPYTTTMSNNDLLKHGFKWKRLFNLTTKNNQGRSFKVILIEETEQNFRRLKYFHKMKEYRDSGRNIIHLEVVDVSRYYKDSAKNEVIAVLAASISDGVIINTEVESDLNEWIQNTLYNVPENSVFVLEPTDLVLKEFCVLPTNHSQKSKMMKWLDCYNIPYETTAHRAELFNLIQKYKGRCPPKYKYCEYLKALGHDVILRPKELSYTKYFDFLLKDLPLFVSMNDNFNENFSMCLSKVKLEDCLKQDRIMAQKEMEIYYDDQKFELLIDKVIESIKYQKISESELKTYAFETAPANNDFYNSILCKYQS